MDTRLKTYFALITHDILDKLSLFESSNHLDDEKQRAALNQALSNYLVNLVVDNAELKGAPVIIEDNPLIHSLFGSIDYQFISGKVKTGFMRIRAGSLHQAHGGFNMLHLNDLLTDSTVWSRLRRLLRSNRLQIEEPSTALAANVPAPIEPKTIDICIKIVLIGSREDYYLLQQEDPEFIRRFRVKVDFADSFRSSPQTYHASSIFVAHICHTKKTASLFCNGCSKSIRSISP